MTETNQVIHGDCMDILAEMSDNSIDTIITDPPYGLKFMSKNWDHGIPGIPFWAEMLRVAKPGATLLAFGGTRTHHRLMVAIEDAGWEIRDCLMWLYGSGFPKSANISKMLDKHAGKEREVVGENPHTKGRKFGQGHNEGWERPWMEDDNAGAKHITAPATEAAKTFDGYGTGLKPAYEPIILAMKPIEKNYANNALVWGVAGLNIDGARIVGAKASGSGQPPLQFNGQNHRPFHDNAKPREFDITQGRWPSNVLLSHSENCVRRGEKRVRGNERPNHDGKMHNKRGKGIYGDFKEDSYKVKYTDPNGLETVADWICVEDCAVRLLDEQAGVRKSGGEVKGGNHYANAGYEHGIRNKRAAFNDRNDSGSASRFFYTAKAPNREKWFCCQLCAQAYPNKERDDHGHDIPQDQRKHIVAHPTVKPLEILKYLCTLTKTPSGGVVLDPFAGSGTTALACIETGRDFILIEKESDYYEIAKARVEAARKEPRQAELF